MKIKTWIKFEETYLPKRCRKLRYRECEDYIFVNLKEVDKKELKLAFEDNSFNGKGKIYFYKGELWHKVNDPKLRRNNVITALDYLIYCHENCSTYFFFSRDREKFGLDTTKEGVIKKVKDDMKKYILVNGILYKNTIEPRYEIVTFGCGCNHGGTGLYCSYDYNQNKDGNYFSAIEGKEAVECANKVATARGDIKDVGKFKPFIVCHIPELVKIKLR